VQRSKQLAVMFLLGAFAVGGTLGFTVDRVVSDHLRERESHGDSVRDAFAAEIGLSPAQRAAVDSILDERNRVIDSLIAPVRPLMHAARDSARHAIARRLTSAQRVKFDAYLERTRKQQRD
jgi:hypothetical protein